MRVVSRSRDAGSKWDVVIIGAGAAGLMCAIEAGRRGRKTLLLDWGGRVGRKILISGGGRCNFTNLETRPERFLSSNPHFCKSALARYTPADFLALVEKHHISWHEKKLGQLFCDDSARDIVGLLEEECRRAGVGIQTGCSVSHVAGEGPFLLTTTAGAQECEALVVATGGLSIPPLGASAFGYEIARQYGLNVVPPRPGLVPLTLQGNEGERAKRLSGVSFECVVKTGCTRFRDSALLTHRGLSGPAVLQASSYWRPGDAVSIDLLPDRDAFAWLKASRSTHPTLSVRALVGEGLPRRLIADLAIPSVPLGGLSDDRLRELARTLGAWTLVPAGTEGYRTAEVTVGGVDTRDLSSTTMASREHPGLYFIGEVVDVTGWLGGYNFQWAWASGFAAGQVV